MIKRILKTLARVLLSKYVLRTLGIVIFLGILWMVDLRKVGLILKNSDLSALVAGLVLVFPLAYARAFRWNLIKRRLGIRIPYSHSFLYQMIGQMAFFTPGKIGDFIKAVYLKGEDYSLTNGVISVVGDRIFDVLTMALIGSAAFVYFFQDVVARHFRLVVGVTTVAVLLAGLLVRKRRWIFELFRTGIMFFVPGRFQQRVAGFFDDLQGHLSEYSVLWIGNLFLISFVAFVLQVLRIYIFALAIGISVSFFQLAGIIALMSLSNLLPITFVGLGTRDAVFLYFFGLLGVLPEKALGLSLIVFVSIVVVAGSAALLFMIKPPAISVSTIFDGEN